MRKLSALFLTAGALVFSLGALAAPSPNVEPQALAALDKMSAYLRSLNSFEIRSDTVTDAVLDNDQTVQFTGTVIYRVKRPNGFVISVADDRKVRQFNYDGKSFTIFSPRLGYYATVPAPPTIRELLTNVSNRYGLELPLADLFRWGAKDDDRKYLTSGYVIGYAKINGLDADQYAFREGDIDWQIWIQRGNRPVPLKAVITDTSDPARPVFAATMSWTINPTFNEATFAFKPPKDAKLIVMAKR